ncbi:hypothetical protein Y032_0011g1258 [Ancylostoma ceylanicum]|uniref:Uncharacterized protein n=1 Tax=Ancylostoma ceylanicum TaxID=53326 RepID=A0A016VE65_9BILA|nr:hypothetical protein Y032_0011g1258 [Ancylostoma ceylanicum]
MTVMLRILLLYMKCLIIKLRYTRSRRWRKYIINLSTNIGANKFAPCGLPQVLRWRRGKREDRSCTKPQ